ncbi:hypothetical protein CYLTODRAFT_425873 [Cylindrobasidium torrendii FP15055 ss-10]|uniref:Zn(2)-C6 fungal-type domain-containing protein n=1 Tax=Cylindrobasidium torrendii FP15055 ss-10 TaxID=1314674 RepID=A0A0D7B0N3_9AGAR|nr:hypothetical protein CYLTODRAFT_425873 [Cylindrobasidium torrendii FP15055 ss-10]
MSENPTKRRRLANSCDSCKKRKIKCDSSEKKDGEKCSNCIVYGAECTHEIIAKKRGPKSAYVEGLEHRLKQVEGLLQQMSGSSPSIGSGSDSPSPPSNAMPVPEPLLPSLRPDVVAGCNCTDDDMTHVDLVEKMERLTMYNNPRFFGASSSFSLAKTALHLKETTVGVTSETRPAGVEYWYLKPWERATAERHLLRMKPYVFPPADLLRDLCEIYFTNINHFMPALHRPSFDKHLSSHLHLRDPKFADLVLMVCAVASVHSNDLRVRAEGHEDQVLSAGWKYFEQVDLGKNIVWEPVSLFELQTYALSINYLQSTTVPQTTWTQLGVALRLAVEIGIHRRKPDGYKQTAEDEQFKRTFWCLLCYDRIVSVFLGRPSSVRDEDFDSELPVECDDEYWEIAEDGTVTFNQPKETPSKLAFFIAQLKLCEILAFVMRTLYSIKKSRLVGKDIEQKMVETLDSTMNRLLTDFPEHLRWSSTRPQSLFKEQSAVLYYMYYLTQIEIHRPFSRTSPTSLVMCTVAARSCSRIVEDNIANGVAIRIAPLMVLSPFVSGIVLCMNVWGGRAGMCPVSRGSAYDREIQACLKVLELGSERSNLCGRMWNILKQLAAGTESAKRDEMKLKRPRPEEEAVEEEEAIHRQNTENAALDAQMFPWMMDGTTADGTGLLDGLGLDTDFMKTMDMWAAAPSTFNPNEWSAYVNNNGAIEDAGQQTGFAGFTNMQWTDSGPFVEGMRL